MPKIAVITNSEGQVLGSVRADAIETESGTIQFQSRAPAGAEGGVRSQEVELPEDFDALEVLHKELARRAKSGSAKAG
jgi:hypothetical protein